jgi:uncharacterized RDD family membrane protein YckC
MQKIDASSIIGVMRVKAQTSVSPEGLEKPQIPMSPEKPESPESPESQRRLSQAPDASRAKRIASMMYEGVLLFAVVFLADMLFDTLTQSRHGLMFREGRQVWLFIAIGAYFLVCWYRGGQTLPMRAWHIKLVGEQGYRASFKQLLLRYLLMWLLPLAGMALIHAAVIATAWPAIYMFAIAAPFLVFITTLGNERQFLHDRLAKTRIIDVKSIEADVAAQQKSNAH